MTWAEIAELAGYRSATVARNQAAPRSSRAAPAAEGTVTVREAAEHLGVSPQAIYSMIESGRIRVADKRQRGTRVYLPSES
jgi:excisionase family DNA binding protein